MPPHQEVHAPLAAVRPAPHCLTHGAAAPWEDFHGRRSTGIDAPHTSFRDQLERVRELLQRTLGYWWLVVLVGVVGSVGAYAVVSMRAEFYQSETIIMHRDVIPSDLLRHSGGSAASLRSMHARFSEMLRAKPLLEPIIEESGIFADVVETDGMGAAVEEMHALTRLRSRGGGMFNISFLARDPELARDITRKLAQGLIDWELRLKLESASVTSDFMAEERERLTAELAERERDIAQFLAAHPEFADDGEGASSEPGASIRALGVGSTRGRSGRRDLDDLVDLERRRGVLKAQLRPGRRGRAGGPLSRALRERDRVHRKLDELRAQYTDRHPDVVAALAQLSETNRAIDAERAALTAELESLNHRVMSRRKAVARRSRQLDASSTQGDDDHRVSNLVGLETEWAELLREFRALQERHKAIDSKAFVADMSASSELARQGTQLTVVSAATLPTAPSGFPSWLLLAAGVVASFAAGFALVLARVLTDDRIFSHRDMQSLDAPTLAVIPGRS